MSYEDAAEWISKRLAERAELSQNPSFVKIDFPDSELIHDDPLPGGIEPARLAWRSIAQAGQHLDLVHFYTQHTGNEVQARPYFTLGRAALLGATRAVYLLRPDKPKERRHASLQLLALEMKDLINFIRDWQGGDPLNAEWQRLVSSTENVRNEVRAEMRIAKVDELTETQMLKSVTSELSDGVQNPRLALLDYWRTASSVSHGRSWARDLTEDENRPPALQFAYCLSLSVALLERALQLWDVRRGAKCHA